MCYYTVPSGERIDFEAYADNNILGIKMAVQHNR